MAGDAKVITGNDTATTATRRWKAFMTNVTRPGRDETCRSSATRPMSVAASALLQSLIGE
jgi:hypothetical protein